MNEHTHSIHSTFLEMYCVYPIIDSQSIDDASFTQRKQIETKENSLADLIAKKFCQAWNNV